MVEKASASLFPDDRADCFASQAINFTQGNCASGPRRHVRETIIKCFPKPGSLDGLERRSLPIGWCMFRTPLTIRSFEELSFCKPVTQHHWHLPLHAAEVIGNLMFHDAD